MNEEPERERSAEDARPGDSGDPRAGRDHPAEGFDKEPHHDLANPVEDPDPTEFPDPYEKRPDPRDPEGAGPEDPERGPSTSDPPPPRNYDRHRQGEGEER